MVLLLELRGGLLAPAPIKGAVSRACVCAHTRTAGDFRKASRVSRVRDKTRLTNYNLCVIVLVLSLQVANKRGKYEPE